MGILWEILQSRFIYGQKRKSDYVEDRGYYLKKLEEIHGSDIDFEVA